MSAAAQALAAALLLVAGAAPAGAASLYGRRLAGIELEGTGQLLGAGGKPIGERELHGYLRLREGQPLTRTALRLGLTTFYQQHRDVLSRVSAVARAAEGGRVKLVLVVEPLRRVRQVTVGGGRALDPNALLRAAELQTDTVFSPARLDEAAAGMALAYFREGYRDAVVRWQATPDRDDVRVAFHIDERRPTTLVKLEFSGDLGLAEPVLHAAFELEPGNRLSLRSVDAGLVELRARYRLGGFYRAKVPPPHIAAADGRGVVQLALEAGPRFRLQVRGNRRFPDDVLLGELRYAGEEPLDPAMQRDLAERLRTFYELAGHPAAKVVARESAPPRHRAPVLVEANRRVLGTATDLGLAPATEADERLVTFIVDEGPRARVVGRRFPGATVFTREEFDQRIDVAMEDAMPATLLADRDPALLQEARLSGHADTPRTEAPRPVPAEVFAAGPYHAALDEILGLYKSRGHLDARVGPAELVLCPPVPTDEKPSNGGMLRDIDGWSGRCEPGTALVVVPVAEGRQTVVRAVTVDGAERLPVEQVDRAVTVKPDDPLSFFAVEESRSALAAAYQAEGYLFADVLDEVDIDEQAATATMRLEVHEGPQVRISRIVLQGLNPRTDRALVLRALGLKAGDVATPQARQRCVRNLLALGLFTSASVKLGETPEEERQEEPEKPLVVVLHEKPTVALQVTGGFSAVDGPRVAAQTTFNNLFGRNLTGVLSGKVNYPLPRLLEETRICPSCPVPSDTLERRFYASLLVPTFHDGGGAARQFRLDLVHENLLRPAYQLTKNAGLGSADGFKLPLGIGAAGVTLLVQAELENSEFTRRRQTGGALGLTVADRQAALLPEGTLLMASLRPTITLDARNDRLNPTAGFIGSVALDGSKSFNGRRRDTGLPFEVLLLRVLASGTGYVPLPVWPGRRVVLALTGRFGGIVKAPDSEVVGTKRFFLGGTQTLRGFNEDGVYPQDVRDTLHDAESRCLSLPSGVGCVPRIRSLQAGVVDPSEGGQLLVTGRAELRIGLGESTDLGLFLDAGNLWADPAKFDPTRLRTGAGVGVRFALPVGPAAIDVAANTAPDPLFAEPLLRLHLSVGLY